MSLKYIVNEVLHGIKKSEYDKSFAGFDNAIELNKNFAEAYYRTGMTWSNLGEYNKAITDYDKAIELKND